MEYKCDTCKRWKCECGNVRPIWVISYWGDSIDGIASVSFAVDTEEKAQEFVANNWGYEYAEVELR